MDRVIRLLKVVWAAPVTVFGLFYVLAFWALRWYRWHGLCGDGLVWIVDDTKSPQWLMSLWARWAGHAIGNVVVLKSDPVDKQTYLVHELKHVDQVMRLGVFQPILYLLSYLAIKIGCTGSDPYFSNPFEVDARRAAGQIVDVEGTVKKIKAKLYK